MQSSGIHTICGHDFLIIEAMKLWVFEFVFRFNVGGNLKYW